MEVLHGEMNVMVLVAKRGGCRDHHQSFMDSGQLSPWCGAVGADRAVCPFRAPISCGLVTQLVFHAAVLGFPSGFQEAAGRCLCTAV